jgi:hypothetical protein
MAQGAVRFSLSAFAVTAGSVIAAVSAARQPDLYKHMLPMRGINDLRLAGWLIGRDREPTEPILLDAT